MAAVNFFYLAVDFPEQCLLRLEIRLGFFHDRTDHQEGYRKDHDHGDRHRNADPDHHNEHTDNGSHRSNDLCHTLIQTLSQSIHIVGDP